MFAAWEKYGMVTFRDKGNLSRKSSGQDRQREGAWDYSMVLELRTLDTSVWPLLESLTSVPWDHRLPTAPFIWVN